MNRETFFRGKRINNGVFIYGLPTYDFKFIFNENDLDSPDNYEIIPETLGQYIGRNDKKGNKIFDGDIVLSPTGQKMIVFWSDKYCSFGLKSEGWAFVHWFGEAVESEDCEIIGNIHENQE